MAGFCSRAAGKLQNKEKTFQGQQFDDDLGINWIEFKYRNHDPQIGRFIEIDPLANKYVYNSTYAFSENKVTGNVELEGLEAAPTEDKRPYPERIPQKQTPPSIFPVIPQNGPPASPPQGSNNTIVKKPEAGNSDLIGTTATNMATASKNTLFNDPWLGKAQTTVTVGKKTGEEKAITINTNTLDGKVEGGDISVAGITLGGSPELSNPTIGMSTGDGNEVHGTLPLSLLGVIMKGVSMGSSHTDDNGVVTNTEHSYRPGQNTVIATAAAVVLYFNPYLIPFVPAVKPSLQ